MTNKKVSPAFDNLVAIHDIAVEAIASVPARAAKSTEKVRRQLVR